ncbi:MAG: hypothetical protein JW841_07420 [Deltaproteobacteria bacterium]|nr:hypothetical protein [Deltaproteobacteria bacterium]
MSLRKWLSIVGSLSSAVSGVVGLISTSGCSLPPEERYVYEENPFPFRPDKIEELCGYPVVGGPNFTSISFGDKIKFERWVYGKPINAIAYKVFTISDGRIFGGKYGMKATSMKGDSGGLIGSVTEYWIEVEDVHLIERLIKPQTPPGVRGILPGEVVVREIPDGDVSKVNDAYLVELAPQKKASISIEPDPSEYIFNIQVSQNGEPVAIAHLNDPIEDGYGFDTKDGGIFKIEIKSDAKFDRKPYFYKFYIRWSDRIYSSFRDYPKGRDIWTPPLSKTVSSPKSKLKH